MVPIKQNLVNAGMYGVKCPYAMVASRIVVHNTANDASAEDEINYMKRNNNEVSFHYAIDDKEIVQGILEQRNAWHAGDGRIGIGNRQGLSIEICYSKSGGEKFIQAEKNAAEFIAMKLKERGWGIDKVTKHQDYSGKYCPHRTLDMGWQRFLDMICSCMGEAPKPVAPTNRWTDQIMEVGSLARFRGVFRVDQVLAHMDSIWCAELTGNGENSIQAGPLTKCTKDGVPTPNQVFSVGDYFFCNEKFKVLAVDAPMDDVQINVGCRVIWVYAGPLDEVQ